MLQCGRGLCGQQKFFNATNGLVICDVVGLMTAYLIVMTLGSFVEFCRREIF